MPRGSPTRSGSRPRAASSPPRSLSARSPARPDRRELPLRLPGLSRIRLRPRPGWVRVGCAADRSRLDRLLADRPRLDLPPPHPRRPAARRGQRAQRRPDRRPRAAAEEQGERPQPDQPQSPRRIRGADRARPRDRPGGSGRLPLRLRADDAPGRRRPALLLRRRLLRPDPRGRPGLAGACRRPRRRDRRRVGHGRERRLPPLLPQRQRRRQPARLADEERRRGPGRARRRARDAAQPRRRHHPRRPARGVQARLRQPRAALAHIRDRLRPRCLPTLSADRPATGFFPAYRMG